jgi:NLI interacting factor-like phosphatase
MTSSWMVTRLSRTSRRRWRCEVGLIGKRFMTLIRPSVLALDLEGTLISNAMSRFPQPGLLRFLEGVQAHFPRVVLFTAVSEARVRPILELLVDEGTAPLWFRAIEIVTWTGEVKDLRFIDSCEPLDARLVDDLESYVHPEQRAQWVPIIPFVAPYAATDRELDRVLGVLTE